MIAAWMAFTILVTAASGLFAWSIDRISSDRGWPRRFVWLSAIALAGLAVGARALAPLLDRTPVPAPSGVVLLDGLRIPVASEARRAWLDPALITIWTAGSLALVLFGVFAAITIARKARTWRKAQVEGLHVWVSEDTGPAVVGVVRPRIVLPDWSLAEASLPMMVAHEREHVRAGDSRTLAIAHLVLAAAPWNLPLWWIVHRLRSAIESDCDLRVLRAGGVDTRRYCELLITVGGARQVRLHPLVALAEPRSRLEERIDQMTRGRLLLKKPVVLGLALLSTAALGLACSLPGLDVTGPGDVPTEVAADLQGETSMEALRAGPTFTPFTVRPDLVNGSEVREVLREEYPPLLREAGVEGTTTVWMLIDDTGEVLEARVQEPSEHPALDEAALRVVMRMEFTAALNRDQPVPVWVAFPIRFLAEEPAAGVFRDGGDPRVYMFALRERMAATGDTEAEARAYLKSLGRIDPTAREGFEVQQILDADDPSQTFYTTPPIIQNVEAVRAALEEEHPPQLQELGIGGTVDVWFHIDETGQLTHTRINESSGNEALDIAALRVATQIEFSPALNEVTPIPVWVSFPITFRP